MNAAYHEAEAQKAADRVRELRSRPRPLAPCFVAEVERLEESIARHVALAKSFATKQPDEASTAPSAPRSKRRETK